MSLATLSTKVEQLLNYTKTYKEVRSMQRAYYGVTEPKTIWLFDTSKITDFSYCFMNSKVKDIYGLNTSSGEQLAFMFINNDELESIHSVLDFSKAKNSTKPFNGCSNLKNIQFKPNSIFLNATFANSDKLTDESTQSIIDGLADLTGRASQTLSLHNNVGAKLTDEQKAAITAKNWNLVY